MVRVSGVTQQQAAQKNLEQYEQLIRDGTFVPNRFPYNSMPIVLLFLFLLLPRRYSGPVVRISTAFAIASMALGLIFYTRSKDPSTGAMLGMLNGYLVLWTIAHLVDVDPKAEYARIVRDDNVGAAVNGASTSKSVSQAEKTSTEVNHVQNQPDTASLSKSIYRWQRFPETVSERFDWSLDLFTSFDGMGWSWAIGSLQPPPTRVQESLRRDKDGAQFNDKLVYKKWRNRSAKEENTTSAALLRRVGKQLLFGYIVVDVLKTMVSVDPWFYGQFDAPDPPFVPESLCHPVIIRAVRLLVGIGCLQYVIYNAMMMRTLIYMALQQRKDIGARGEAWMYGDLFGSVRSVLQFGLAGFWSQYWHQVFRCVFTAPSRLLIRLLNISSRSATAMIVRFGMAFFCSGLLHASMSYALIGPSDPMIPLLFFLSQTVGIAIQYAVPFLVSKTPIENHVPKWLRQASNLIWALTFLYFSGYPLAKDLAQANAFVFEPVPISPLRAVFGCEKDGYYCWRGRWFRWVTDGWRTGLEA